jgi:FkbM family methyltransferase
MMESIIEQLIKVLPELRQYHSPKDEVYGLLKGVARSAIEELFYDREPNPKSFPPFGNIVFPYVRMGAVDSLNLFDIDELIIFSFYWSNRKRYRNVADVGANIGLHTIVLNKCGFDVRAYEPDPLHFSMLQKNIELNHCNAVDAHNCAVSSESGQMEFVRVLGNTTGSHLAGSKADPYGELQRFPVRLETFKSITAWANLVKLDVEGHERQIILATQRNDWQSTDAIIEVENANNARALFKHFNDLNVNMFSQKSGWRLVRDVEGMPSSYKEGMLFASYREEMPWE